MRDYGVVSPKFWTGSTGKTLRGDVHSQLVAVYLMTSPHANMIGAYYCPLDYIAKEIGLPLEGATKALQSLIEAHFCSFDEQTEEVFVHRMAAFQIGEHLDPKDNRCKGVARELERVDSERIRAAFSAIYFEAFHLPGDPPKRSKKPSPSKAPPKPEAGSEAGSEAENKPGVRFPEFWLAWPKHERKQDKKVCREKWVAHALDAVADVILADVQAKKATRKWRDGFIEAPEVYINNRRWEDGQSDLLGEWWKSAGFADSFEAENAGCRQHNATQFRDGKRIPEVA